MKKIYAWAQQYFCISAVGANRFQESKKGNEQQKKKKEKLSIKTTFIDGWHGIMVTKWKCVSAFYHSELKTNAKGAKSAEEERGRKRPKSNQIKLVHLIDDLLFVSFYVLQHPHLESNEITIHSLTHISKLDFVIYII